jgi:hypothetical protein
MLTEIVEGDRPDDRIRIGQRPRTHLPDGGCGSLQDLADGGDANASISITAQPQKQSLTVGSRRRDR